MVNNATVLPLFNKFPIRFGVPAILFMAILLTSTLISPITFAPMLNVSFLALPFMIYCAPTSNDTGLPIMDVDAKTVVE